MFFAVSPILTLLVAAAFDYVRADPDPNNPGPGDVFIQGKSCTIGWNVDPTGTWKNMEIDLMTGDNFNMVFLTTVATNVDATSPSKNTLSWTCPQVTPHSAVYFYQFSSPSTSNKTWTGRFTITDSTNDIVPPAQSTQPDGEKIPWGTGSLVSGSSSSASASSAAASSRTSTSAANAVSSISSTTSASSSPSSSQTLTPSVVYLTTDVTVATGTPSTAGANGAVATLSVSNIFQTGLTLGLAALGFTVMF